ncbi:MAG: DNA topoisomerase VI subunit B, partial [Deltaproteobacteria bacterium]
MAARKKKSTAAKASSGRRKGKASSRDNQLGLFSASHGTAQAAPAGAKVEGNGSTGGNNGRKKKRAGGGKTKAARLAGKATSGRGGSTTRRSGSAAERLARQQREISISEFFTKNRHLLGFDNPQKALLTTVKEAVDNSLDACEEAGILPEIKVEISAGAENRYRVLVVDNGPGIVHSQVRKIFGKLLYGSKFHRLKQSRGQQGIGISAAVMYSQLTTGKPVTIVSRTRPDRPAHKLTLKIDTKRNAPEVLGDSQTEWSYPYDTGTAVEMEIEGVYRAGKRSVDQYIRQTAIANPHASITYRGPKDDEHHRFERLSDELPRQPTEIKPHPHGVELGVLMSMLKETKARNIKGALMRDFSRISDRIATEICKVAGLPERSSPKHLKPEQIEALHRAMGQVKVMNPPASCVVPIGEELLRASLEQGVEADFFTSVTRPPAVYRGNPFQVEVALAWGGNLPAEEPVTLYRFANRVPLQYQQSDCAITRAVLDLDWRHYKVSQPRGALPVGPMIIVVHLASVWVPFTSESKEAVARYPEILREIRLALQQCARRLSVFLSAKRRQAEQERKHSYIETYIPHIGIALREILNLKQSEEQRLVEKLKDTLRRSRKIS